MNIKIMVAAHKKFLMPKNRKLYLPILVGAINNYKPEIDYQRDDDGTNISNKNPNYNELTALYWAWKNFNVDVIGLVHYRRFLSLHKRRSINSILTKNEVEELLMEAPIVLPQKRKYYIETNYSHYVHAHKKEPLTKLRSILEEEDTKYSEAYDAVMGKRSAHMFNMFIMKKEYFDEYASWLFQTLFKLESEIDISEYDNQEKRVFGYLSELMMDIWITANHYKFVECNWIFIGKRKIFKKLFFFIMRKFGILKKTHF